jgi:ACS family allantoate permease-like MFS transporter
MATDTVDKTEKLDLEQTPTLGVAEKGEVIQLDADEALNAVAGLDTAALRLDEETERRLLRKIDWNLMPVSHIYLERNFSHC